MSSLLLVGITGGIGSGKSVVSRIFNTLGVPVYNADQRARELVVEETGIRKGIIKLLGPNAFTGNTYNTSYVASRVFKEPDLLTDLNNLIHPAVGLDFKNWVSKHSTSAYLIKEAALLFESGSYKELNKVVLVTAPYELRIERVLERDPHRDRAQVENIIARQWEEEKKRSLADQIIRNGPEDLLIPQVLALHRSFSGL